MAERRCENCGESVDEAKAFCPACGHAFVKEEKREQSSDFDRLDSTVQLGQTMYNQMLSDMGLNVSKSTAPPAPEKRVQVVTPVAPAAPAPRSENASAVPGDRAPKPSVDAKAKKNYLIWIIVGATIAVLGLALVVVLAAVLILYYASSGTGG